MMDHQMLLNAGEVAALLSLNKKTFYQFLKSSEGGSFPKPIQFGPRLSRWKSGEVKAWVDSQTAGDHAAPVAGE